MSAFRRSIVAVGVVMLQAACGDTAGETSSGGAGATGGQSAGGASSIEAEGAYVGDVAIQTDVVEDAVYASAEIVVAADGTVSGMATTKAPSTTVGEIGTVSGTLSPASATTYDADLTFSWPTMGTFTAAGALTHSASAGQLAGQLSARDERGALVGSTVVAVHQE